MCDQFGQWGHSPFKYFVANITTGIHSNPKYIWDILKCMFGELAKLGKSYAKGLLSFMLLLRGYKVGKVEIEQGGN